jgi:hypothetical protein
MKLTLYFLACLLFLAGPLFAQEKFILVGSGGGITGVATVYKITRQGKVFKGSGIAEYAFTECSKIKSKKAKIFLSRLSVQFAAAEEFDHPGNLYYFISLSENKTEDRKTWGDPAYPPATALQELYREIHDTVNKLNYKPFKQ